MTQYAWWQEGVIYQIYPRSFMDGNNDGVGDLNGITQRLDYLQWLGVDAIWLSPIYPSPMADFGYDISNYTDVEPLFGDLADFDRLLEQVHQRGMKLILDFVPCHSSDQHPWFREARSSRDNPKRDWYIWRDPAPDGGVPNNWLSNFGGTAWQYDEQTQQYYLHMFDVKQPDLNWRNPEVRNAMFEAMRFWLERGVDGFRVDVIWMMIKDIQFRDNPLRPNWKPGDSNESIQIGVYTEDQPEVHEIIRDMRALVDAYAGDRVLIGEIYLEAEKLVKYYGSQLDEVHMPFNFQFITMEGWSAETIRSCVDPYEAMLPTGAWPNWVLGNHDRPRIATRIGRDQIRVAQMLLLTLRGTPTCYYGDELGMENVVVPVEMINDPAGKKNPLFSRDPERSPMQWDASPNAGFSAAGVQPWLPIAKEYQQQNIEVEQQDLHSYLSLVRALLSLRHSMPALSIGMYTSVLDVPEGCFAFLREHEEQRILVVLNCSGHDLEVTLPHLDQGRIILATGLDREGKVELSALRLPANEGYIIEL